MKTDLTSALENSRNYTLAVAQAMSEDLYNFKPTPETWSFLELMNHIGYGILWWKDNFIKKTETKWAPPPPKSTRNETIHYLQQCYQTLQETVSNEALTDEVVSGLWATLDHVTHHRGQAVLYLRLNGIAAPAYVF
jgi:uncharacterized damage-inducible protein DinB